MQLQLISAETFHLILIFWRSKHKKHDVEIKKSADMGPVVAVRCFRLASIRSWFKSHHCQRVYLLDHQVQTIIKKDSQQYV